MAKRKPLEQSFWEKVSKTEGCWLWMGGKNGAGRATLRGKSTPRFAYELLVGPIPEGMYVCHTCDEPACVNPAHLWIGTQRDNVHDMIRKGRKAIPKMPKGEKHWNCRLTKAEVEQIRRMAKDGHTQQTIADRYGMTRRYIGRIIARDRWA